MCTSGPGIYRSGGKTNAHRRKNHVFEKVWSTCEFSFFRWVIPEKNLKCGCNAKRVISVWYNFTVDSLFHLHTRLSNRVCLLFHCRVEECYYYYYCVQVEDGYYYWVQVVATVPSLAECPTQFDQGIHGCPWYLRSSN